MSAAVRALCRDDRDAWAELWAGYNAFYRGDVPAQVTARTFERLCDGADGFYGVVAVGGDDRPVGLAHAIFHPSTWSDGVYCYLEDLFVARDARGITGGIGQALIEAVYEEADRRGADRVYWHTQEYNAPARSLYDTVANRTSFVVYQR